MKTFLAVFLGYATWTVIWLGGWGAVMAASPGSFAEDGSTTNSGILVGFLGLSVVISILSGWVAKRIAGEAPSKAVRILAILLLASGIFFQAQSWSLMPLWFHLPFLALLYPATMLGGRR